jgi:O-antigen ligase
MLLIIVLQLMIIIYAGYQHLFLRARVTLALTGGTDATGAAYTVAFISFYTILVLQHSASRWKEVFILGTFSLPSWFWSLQKHVPLFWSIPSFSSACWW